MDENGHINNARLVGYIQEGIYDLFHHHAKAVRASLFPDGFLIARHEIDYLEQLHHRPEPLQIRLVVERLGRSSAHVRVEVCRGSSVYMRARTVVVARDRASGRSRKLSQSERCFLSDYLTVGSQSGQAPHGAVPPQVRPRLVPPQARPDQTHPGQPHPGQTHPGQPHPSRKIPLPSRLPARVLCRA
ncbi:thioesterase family protein [Kitasatospora sp. NPDC052896]|uniref:acyl-CoA thioesterase n=1 Tax=Kitasatospora sp. NPDC052896 TaxID=3364061 RepID=UPI0037C8E18B